MEVMYCDELPLGGSPMHDPSVVWLDIETMKVASPDGWPYRERWSTFMVGLVEAIYPAELKVEVWAGDEAELINELSDRLAGAEVRYAATRDFDQMVLRGRFTNARRAHNPEPGNWPNLDEVEIEWVNVRAKGLRPVDWDRAPDVESYLVPRAWRRGEREVVATHCLRDVVELYLRNGDPRPRLRKQLVRLMSS